MTRIMITILIAVFGLSGCDRDEKQAKVVSPPPPLKDVPPAPQLADVPGEQPLPSVRTYPTGSIPDDPHLARGHRVYREACMVCHDSGAANAPPITDVPEWRTRIAKGREILYDHAINGFTGTRGLMPAKGGNPSRPDDEVRAAVDYMVYVVERQK